MDRSVLFPLLTPEDRCHGQDESRMNRYPTLPSTLQPPCAEPGPALNGRPTGRRTRLPFFIRWWLALHG
jgi:hypothetical protein